MEIRYFKHWSSHLNREMEFKVYGHSGKPVLFIPCQAGSFVDFEIDLTTETVVLPDGVTGSGASFNGAQHGWVDYTIGFKVDGPVKMTFGGCNYAGKQATVTSHKSGAVLATIDTKTPGCYHNGGVATWTYNSTEEDSLIVYLGQYSPYFKAEATEAVSNFTVTYFDQNGTKLGEESVSANATFTPAYAAKDLILQEGYAFRGWKKADGVKVAEGTVILTWKCMLRLLKLKWLLRVRNSLTTSLKLLGTKMNMN